MTQKWTRSWCNWVILCNKALCKMYCRQWKWDSAYTHNCIHTSFCLDFSVSQVCFQFSFVCLVWFTGFISLVPSMTCFSGETLLWPQMHTFDIWRECLRHMTILALLFPSFRDSICTQHLNDSWNECHVFGCSTEDLFNLSIESLKRPHDHLGFPEKSVLPQA